MGNAQDFKKYVCSAYCRTFFITNLCFDQFNVSNLSFRFTIKKGSVIFGVVEMTTPFFIKE